jgi:host factor-I protein
MTKTATKTQTMDLQDLLLDEAKKQNVEVTIFTVNGVKQEARIIGFDKFIVLADVKGKTQMFYKHALSTIVFPSNFKMPNQ